QFIPIVNVALAPWVQFAANECAEKLTAVLGACGTLELATVKRDLPCARLFPFDASILLPSRWRSVFEEQGLQGDPKDPIDWGNRKIGGLLKQLADPNPYVACLVADGDGMGAAIEKLGSAPEHRTFSKQLARFAGEARDIVEQKHLGSLVYSGGDDVL